VIDFAASGGLGQFHYETDLEEEIKEGEEKRQLASY